MRFPLIEKMQSHWDGPQYSIAVVRYSLIQETPAPPGYPLYIAMGRLFYFFTHDPHKALLFVSVLFSGIGASVFYWSGRLIFNKITGIIAASIFLSGSTFYYFGLTTYAYGITPVVITILMSILYLIIFKKKQLGLVLGLAFSIIVGIRPQELMFVLPMFLAGIIFLPGKQRFFAIAGSIAFFLIWFLPYLKIVGGLDNYIKVSNNFAKGAILPFSFQNLFEFSELMLKGFWLSFGVAGIFILYYPYKLINILKNNNFKLLSKRKKQIIFFMLWFLPSFLFNLFIRTDHAGYQMEYLSALTILISFAVWSVLKKKNTLNSGVLLIILLNLFIFFRNWDKDYSKPYRPTSFHYSDIRKNDLILSTKVNFIKEKFNPKTTLIIITPTLWRPIMYHFSEYLVYEIDGLFTKEKKFEKIIRISRNWNSEMYYSDQQKFTVPDNIETLILFDSESNFWINGKGKKVYSFGKNIKITSLPVNQQEVFSYNLYSIEKVDK